MKKILFLCSSLLLFHTLLYAQSLVPFEKDSLWGYCRMGTQQEVIAPAYQKAWPFKNGKAVVEKKYRYYIIDENNKVLSRLPYQNIDFNYGLASVKVKGKYGFIDYSGELVINPVYEQVEDFDDKGIITAHYHGEVGEINRYGQMVSAFVKDTLPDSHMQFAYGVPNYQEPTFVSKPEDGIAKYSYKGYFGYANTKGTILIPAKYYASSELFVGELCLVEYFSFSDRMSYYKEHLDAELSGNNKDSLVINGEDTIHYVHAIMVLSHHGYIDKSGVEYFDSPFTPEKFIYKEFYSNGKISRKCIFIYDQIDGDYFEYDDKGEITRQRKYKNGKFISEIKYEDGVPVK